jgi:ATP-dependent RNA helicase TDRD9
MLDLDPPVKMLALVIDPPRLDNIARTILTLKEIGALFAKANGVVSPVDGDLSYLGRVVARLPIDVHLGKLVMLGIYIFHIIASSFLFSYFFFLLLSLLVYWENVDLMCVCLVCIPIGSFK